MSVTLIDALKYPRLVTYLRDLPAELDSYPQVRTRGHFSNILREKLGAKLTSAPLPFSLRARLLQAHSDTDLIPCVIYCALSALARDTLWRDEAAYRSGMFDIAKTMYGSAFHRAVFYVLSPSLVVLGASKRWGSVYEGTALRVKSQGKGNALLAIEYPGKVFDLCSLQSIGAGFCAAVAVAGATNSACVVNLESAGRATFALSWDV